MLSRIYVKIKSSRIKSVLQYSKIRFNMNKWFGPNAIYSIFHIELPCVFRILCIPNSEHKIESLEYIIA